MGLNEYRGVEFEDEKYMPETTVTETSGFYGYLLAKGVVKNRNQANLLMIAIILIVGLAIFLIFQSFFNGQRNAPELAPEDSWRAGNPNEIDNSLR